MDDATLRRLAEEARRPRRAWAHPLSALFRARTEAAAPPDPGPPPGRPPVPALRPGRPDPARAWADLGPVALDLPRLEGNGLFPKACVHPAAAAFDILRTRTLMTLRDRGWRRLAVASPTPGCGASLVAANLALGLARRPGARVVLLDLDLRRPALAGRLGVQEAAALGDVLAGRRSIAAHLLRAGHGLALGLNGLAEAEAAEVLQSAAARAALARVADLLDPEAMILDLPAVLAGDEVIAARGLCDALLLVADGTRTTEADLLASTDLLDGQIPLLGVVLNRAQDAGLSRGRARAGGRQDTGRVGTWG